MRSKRPIGPGHETQVETGAVEVNKNNPIPMLSIVPTLVTGKPEIVGQDHVSRRRKKRIAEKADMLSRKLNEGGR